MRYWVVMPAAGSGSRFGGALPKQYAALEGRTVIEWALAPFLEDSRCVGVMVAVAAGDPHWAAIARRLPERAVSSAPGGAQRSLSVRSALLALGGRAAAADWILVHDAARPCLDAADLARLLQGLASHPLGGLLATPAADTLKRAREKGGSGPGQEVAETIDRSFLWRALTPQMFRHGRLCAALDAAHNAGRFPSDEAQAIEWAGEHPQLIEGRSSNLKVTTADELALAAAILRARRVSSHAKGAT
jgi:2-C-methyl-D-erythritol 4-phosphate cytidylyltransferase